MSTNRAAIFDLDGTLCEIGHRLHHVQNGARNWDAFFNGIPDDDLNAPIRDVLIALYERGENIVLCSGRPEKCRNATEEWLKRYSVPFVRLYMRPDDDTRPDHIVKAQILTGIKEDGFDPFIVIDDRQSVVDMWRENGLTCLQCAPDESAIPETAKLTLMVGPSGAGKSTWLRSEQATAFGVDQSHIVSSDQIRHELCGDFKDQTTNHKVFQALHAIVRARLKHGLAAVVDATNIRRRDRMACAALGGPKIDVRYIVIDRPMEIKRRDAGWRAALPIDLLAKHDQTFHSQIKEILAGDGLSNVTVIDLRESLRAVA